MCTGKLQTSLLVVGYFVYLLVGAAVFQALERTAEKQEKIAAAQMKEAFLQNFTHLTIAEIEQFMKNLTKAIQNGVYPVGNESQIEDSNWDFSDSFFFAGTVVSTIGYGTLHPKTAGGQIFCVFFALFGIPLNIVFLHRVGKMLSLLCKKLGKFLYEKGMRKKKIKFLTLLFFLVMGILVFLCLPSLFFQITEGWSYSEGIYFAFITLSTIGFGDYVVAEEKGTAVEYLPRRTNQPTPDPFPELFCDEVQKSCTSICALQDLKRVASILASFGQLHNGK
ncbi:hypothetical protein Q9966_010331 [Columba livia]|nr:hypothetical protein Q9966_010331 [Columba livia]